MKRLKEGLIKAAIFLAPFISEAIVNAIDKIKIENKK